MEAIVAVYSDWGIGSGGTQPVVLKADRAHFKELTDGAAVIVGRKRWAISPAAGRSRGGTTSSSPGRISKSPARRSRTAPGRR